MREDNRPGQRALQERAFRSLAERDETFFRMLPTLTRAELEALIAKRPAVWARYAGFLKNLK